MIWPQIWFLKNWLNDIILGSCFDDVSMQRSFTYSRLSVAVTISLMDNGDVLDVSLLVP
jgi:hypothetical protein